MIRHKAVLVAAGLVALFAGSGMATTFTANAGEAGTGSSSEARAENANSSEAEADEKQVSFSLRPSSNAIERCLPQAKIDVVVDLVEEETGRDVFKVNASGLSPDTLFTIFVIEKPADPFGAAEYFGDFETDKDGKAQGEFRLIIEEAFSSTLVKNRRFRVDLNHVGVWFGDQADDDFCFGSGAGEVTPFDGDGVAGAQVMNTAQFVQAAPLP